MIRLGYVRLPIFLSWFVASVSAIAGPSTLADCQMEAAKSPTPQGVILANKACVDKFAKAPQSSGLTPEGKAAAWASLYDRSAFTTVDSVSILMGAPSLVTGPAPCYKWPGDPPKEPFCYTYYWKDDRPGRVNLYFQLEALVHTNEVWAAWPDSLQ